MTMRSNAIPDNQKAWFLKAITDTYRNTGLSVSGLKVGAYGKIFYYLFGFLSICSLLDSKQVNFGTYSAIINKLSSLP